MVARTYVLISLPFGDLSKVAGNRVLVLNELNNLTFDSYAKFRTVLTVSLLKLTAAEY